MGFFTGLDWTDITYKCCLPHDLEYGYGVPGDEEARKAADFKIQLDLIEKANMSEWLATIFHRAVDIGGAEIFGLSFSWAFANKSLSD
jgi:hypothetical protein